MLDKWDFFLDKFTKTLIEWNYKQQLKLVYFVFDLSPNTSTQCAGIILHTSGCTFRTTMW